MPSTTMVDVTPLKRRPRSAALSSNNAGAAAFSGNRAGSDAAKPKAAKKTVASRYLAPFSKPTASISISTRSAASSATTTASSTATAPGRSASSPAPGRAAFCAVRTLLPNTVAAAANNASGNAVAATRTLPVAFQSPTYCFDASSRVVRSVSEASQQNTYRRPPPSSATAVTRKLEYSAPPDYYKRTPTGISAAARRQPAYEGTPAPRRASVDGGANEYLQQSSLCSDTDRPRGVATSGTPSPSAQFSRDATGTRSDRFAYAANRTVASRAHANAFVASPSPSPVKKKASSLFNGLLSSSPLSKLSLNKKQQRLPSPGRTVTESPFPRPPRRSVDSPGLFARKLACSFDGDVIKVRTPAGSVRSEDEHRLRLLYTRHLQWRHANAKAAVALSSRRAAAEKTLYGACVAVLQMRKSVTIAKLQLQRLQNDYKLSTILTQQMIYLEEWSSLERIYSNSLSGIARALNATVVRLPISDGAMVDSIALKNIVGSAVDVMQSIANSTSTQLSKLAQTIGLASQLSRVVDQELALVPQCRDLLSTLASMHVRYCSLQGQKIQVKKRKTNIFLV